jgi:hypothetical protein
MVSDIYVMLNLVGEAAAMIRHVRTRHGKKWTSMRQRNLQSKVHVFYTISALPRFKRVSIQIILLLKADSGVQVRLR